MNTVTVNDSVARLQFRSSAMGFSIRPMVNRDPPL